MITLFDKLIEQLGDAIAEGERPTGWVLQRDTFNQLISREERFYQSEPQLNGRPATLLGLPYEIEGNELAQEWRLVTLARTVSLLEPVMAEAPSATLTRE